MITIIMFFIIGQALNLGLAFWILWGINIVLWIIRLTIGAFKLLAELSD